MQAKEIRGGRLHLGAVCTGELEENAGERMEKERMSADASCPCSRCTGSVGRSCVGEKDGGRDGGE